MYFLTNFIISILRDDLPKLTKRKLKKTGEKESPKGKMEKKKKQQRRTVPLEYQNCHLSG